MIVLNLGAGTAPLPGAGAEVTEIRVDLKPPADVVTDIRALPFADDYADAIYSSHVIEHFDEHEIVPLLREWRRVLKPGGRITLACPDFQWVATMVAALGVDAPLYADSEGRPIRGQDIVYGHQEDVRTGADAMRHRVAFDSRKLMRCLQEAGFESGMVEQHKESYNLFARATK